MSSSPPPGKPHALFPEDTSHRIYQEKFSPFTAVPVPAYTKPTSKEKTTQTGQTLDERRYDRLVQFGRRKGIAKDAASTYARDTVTCVQKMNDIRVSVLGKSSQWRRHGEGYLHVVYNILSGHNHFDETLTIDELCSLYEYGLKHPFWTQFIKTPEGIRRNLLKLWNTEGYLSWEKQRSVHGAATVPVDNVRTEKRVVLEADAHQEYDTTYVSPEWENFI